MKTTLLTAAFALILGTASAQKIKEAEVPAPVKEKFAALYPGTKAEKWEKEGANYEAEFEKNEVETSVLFDASGNLLETETEISPNDLPQAAKDYMLKNKPGEKIHEASKIVSANGTVTYEAEVKDGDYIFDANGNFISKEAEDKDNDKDHDKGHDKD
jgi:hypothetical protein